MTPAGPLSRPVVVGRIPAAGLDVTVEASEAERTAVAAELGLPSIAALVGAFRVVGDLERVHVTGRITATIEQICVVSLDPFESTLDEEVALDFESPERAAERGGGSEIDADLDVPDEIVGGRIDLGRVTQEFLALGLDPYPRKPGVDFEAPEEGSDDLSPFAALKERGRDTEP